VYLSATLLVKLRFIWRKRLSRYFIIGSFNSLFGLILMTVLKLSFSPLLSGAWIYSIAALSSFLFAYFTQRRYVWRSENELKRELPKFIVVACFMYLFNLFLIIQIVDKYDLPLLTSQIAIAIALTSLSFFCSKLWVFSSKQNK
jgi:putative flippase GtrA